MCLVWVIIALDSCIWYVMNLIITAVIPHTKQKQDVSIKYLIECDMIYHQQVVHRYNLKDSFRTTILYWLPTR